MLNLNNKIKINMINRDNKILILINLFFIKMRLIVHNINFNNLINYIINMIIVKYRLFTIDKIIIKRFKKHINSIKMNISIEKNTHFLFYKKNFKINCRLSFLKINH